MGNDFKDLFGDWRPDEENPGRSNEIQPEPENRMRRALNEKEVKIVNVYEAFSESQAGQQAHATTFVLLRDNRGRELRIFVLRDVALAISLALESEVSDRPFTHDLMKNILDRLGAVIDRVTIDDLWQDTFYAKITLSYNTESIDIDARPSDAIALALRFKAPVYVAESVLEAAAQE